MQTYELLNEQFKFGAYVGNTAEIENRAKEMEVLE